MMKYEVSVRAMKTSFDFVMYGEDRDVLMAAGNDAMRVIGELDRLLNFYDSASEVSWMNYRATEKPVRVDPDIFDLLAACRSITQQADGAFDITVGPLARLWKNAMKEGRLPAPEDIEAATMITGMDHVILNEDDRTVFFEKPGIQIDLGAVAKGYAVDRAIRALKEAGVKMALVHAGSSTIYALGAPPEQDGWRVAIRNPDDPDTPFTEILLRDEAMSTSGQYEQSAVIQGEAVGHIVDPRVGKPVEGPVSTSAVAPTATESDALATAFFILGKQGIIRYCNGHSRVRAILVELSPADETPTVVHIPK